MNLHLHPRTVGSSPTIATPVAATHPLPVLDPGFCAAVEAHLVRSTAQWRRAGVAALGLTAAGATIALTVALRRRPSQSLGGAFGGGLVACFAGCVLAVLTVASLQQLQRIRAAARSPRRAAGTEHAVFLHRGRTMRSWAF